MGWRYIEHVSNLRVGDKVRTASWDRDVASGRLLRSWRYGTVAAFSRAGWARIAYDGEQWRQPDSHHAWATTALRKAEAQVYVLGED